MERTADLFILSMVFWIAGCGGQQVSSEIQPMKVENPNVNAGYYRSGDTYIAGQPNPKGLENARNAGVKTVINLRAEGEQNQFDEKKVVESLGMNYVSIPVTSQTLTDDKADKFLETMRAAKGPVMVHCASANRASGFWAIHLNVNKGVPAREAISAAEMSGLKSGPVKDFVENYLQRKGKTPNN